MLRRELSKRDICIPVSPHLAELDRLLSMYTERQDECESMRWKQSYSGPHSHPTRSLWSEFQAGTSTLRLIACLCLRLKVSISERNTTVSLKLTHTLEICSCLRTYLTETTTQAVLFSAHSQMKVQKGHQQENIYGDTEAEKTGWHLLREYKILTTAKKCSTL